MANLSIAHNQTFCNGSVYFHVEGSYDLIILSYFISDFYPFAFSQHDFPDLWEVNFTSVTNI